MVVSGRAELLQPADLNVDVVSLQIEVHALLADLSVGGVLQQDSDVGVRPLELAVDVPAGRSDGLLNGIEGGGPKGDGLSRSSTSITKWQTRLR